VRNLDNCAQIDITHISDIGSFARTTR